MLAELARLYGVVPTYRGNDGSPCRSPDAAVIRVLAALGAPVDPDTGPKGVRDATRSRRQDLWGRVVEPVVVSRGTGRPAVALRLPEAFRGPLRLRVGLEGGGEQTVETAAERLPTVAVRSVGTARYRRAVLQLERQIPEGYHLGCLERDGERHEFLWVSAPPETLPPSGGSVGIFAPLYSLRSERRRDCADLTDLGELGRWAAARGVGLLGTLPLGAAFLEPPVEPSPYTPVSRLFWNEAYLDLQALPELAACPEARALLDEANARVAGDYVDWPQVASNRKRALRLLADRFFGSGGSLATAFQDRFALDDFARFRAVAERHGRNWRVWPAALRDGHIGPGDCDPGAYRYHLYVQWRAEQQVQGLLSDLRRNGADLYLDLPLGVHPDGFDPWRFRHSFLGDCSAGAPPDPFFTRGQDWGFPPPDPGGCRRSHHQYFRASLRHHLAHCGVLRLDHVMGLHRVFCVPDGMAAPDGVYVRQPAAELYAILALESHRNGCAIVGEDLGTVPAATGVAMADHGVQSMHIVQFELAPGLLRRTLSPPAGKLAALNTHDMPTFAAYRAGADIGERVAMGLLAEGDVERERHRRRRLLAVLDTLLRRAGHDLGAPEAMVCAVLLELAASPADIAIVNLEDLWLEERPQNVPGTGPERPNWRRLMRPTLKDLYADGAVAAILDAMIRARGAPDAQP